MPEKYFNGQEHGHTYKIKHYLIHSVAHSTKIDLNKKKEPKLRSVWYLEENSGANNLGISTH